MSGHIGVYRRLSRTVYTRRLLAVSGVASAVGVSPPLRQTRLPSAAYRAVRPDHAHRRVAKRVIPITIEGPSEFAVVRPTQYPRALYRLKRPDHAHRRVARRVSPITIEGPPQPVLRATPISRALYIARRWDYIWPARALKPITTTVAASAAVTGTVISAAPTEADIVAGGKTIIVTLTNDTWESGGTFDAQRQAIIDGLDADLVEALGWNAEVRDKEIVGAVARTSDTVVTITLTAAPDYDITVAETITVTVPADAMVTSSSAVVASPTFGVSVVSVRRGGGAPRRTRRRKRRLILDGHLYEVHTLLEERQLLEGFIERQQVVLEGEDTPTPGRKRAVRISLGKAKARLGTIEDRIEELSRDDDEVLLLFAAA